MTQQIKLILAALSVFFLCFLVWFIPAHYREEGRQEVIHKYQEAERQALIERNEQIEQLKAKHEKDNKEIVDSYEAQIAGYSKRLDAAKRDGLRVPRVACERPSATAETASTKADNAIESIRLPSAIENGLFDLARQADEVNAQLSACQAWIKKNGFAD